nr:prohead protease/major capsid protein fusion protein [Sporomusa sphaeroides]
MPMKAEETKKRRQQEQGTKQYRYLELADMRAVDGEDGVYEFSFSSETPVPRWWGTEILGHDPGEPKLERLKTVGSFLFAHGRDPNHGLVPLGPIVDAWQDEQARTCRIKVRFDSDTKAQEIKGKVDSESLRGVSMGYVTNAYTVVEPGKVVRGFAGPCEIVIDWEPFEVSLEPTAADPNVGIGRSLEQEETDIAGIIADVLKNDESVRSLLKPEAVTVKFEPVLTQPQIQNNQEEQRSEQPMPETNTQSKTTNQTPEEIRAQETQRALEITELCRNFPQLELDTTEFIRSGVTVADVNKEIVQRLAKQRTPIETPAIEFGQEDVDKFRAAASDAMSFRAGLKVEKPAAGFESLRGMTMIDLAREIYQRTHGKAFRGYDRRELVRAVISTSDFPSVLANVANKSLMTAYQTAPTTYQRWTKRGNLNDYKPALRVQVSEAPLLRKVTKGNEYKYVAMSDTGEYIQLEKYGELFSLTREDIINDDLQALTDIPTKFGAAARLTINYSVYSILTGNPKMADGNALFSTPHANIEATVKAAPSKETFKAGFTAMAKQKGLQKKDAVPLNITPAFWIGPVALQFDAMQLVKSAVDVGANNAATNVFQNLLEVVADAQLDAVDPDAYYFATAPGFIDTIEVAFLNGEDTPYIETQPGFEVDGITYKVRSEFGVKALDFRGLYKNPGK